MAKIKISEAMINSIANKDNTEFVDGINEKVNDLFMNAIQTLSSKVSYISLDNVVLQPVNELLNGAMGDNSTFTYFLGVDNAQLELNTINKSTFWKNFKNKLKFAWQNRRKRKRLKKKKKNVQAQEPTFDFDPLKYNIYSLTEDLQDSLIRFLSETSIVYLKENHLQIIGKEDFGPNIVINVYVVSNNDMTFRFYTGKKSTIDIDLQTRFDLLNKNIDEKGENFVKMIKILNLLYFNVNKTSANQVFIESLLNFCPNEFFLNCSIYACFIKVINYLSISSLKNVMSVNDLNKSVLKDVVCQNNVFGYNKMIDSIIE